MLEISEDARQRLSAFIKNQPDETVRIYVSHQTIGGTALAMMFDSKTAEDAVFDIDGITYIIDRKLLADANPIRIDCGPAGISFSCRLKFGDDDCGCGCGCGD